MEIDVESLWMEICIDLKGKIEENRYATWIEVLKPICYVDVNGFMPFKLCKKFYKQYF